MLDTNIQAKIPADVAVSEAVFFKRQRVVGFVFLAWAVSQLGRIPFIATRWPYLNDLSTWCFVLGSILIFALTVWANRCTFCGGGIKLNGRTCAQCGHVFGSHTNAT